MPDAARPPLGCSFHPRCPAAFEVCGWESRDLGDLLEARWALEHEDEYEAERGLIENLGVLQEARLEVDLRARNRRGSDILELLESARAGDPAEPFWRGVRKLDAVGDHVAIRWHEPVTPRAIDVDGVSVECHLYDEEALAEATRRQSVGAEEAHATEPG